MKKIISVLLFLVLSGLYLSAQVEIEISEEKVVIEGEKYYLHTILQGQTLYSICKAYGISESEVLNANDSIKPDNIKLGQVLKIPVVNEIDKSGEYIIYTIKPGDTLYSLCRKYGITEEEFFAINSDLKPNRALKVGQEIKFPIKVIDDKITDEPRDTAKYIYHLVEKGETVYGLTKKYEITKEDLIEANDGFDGVKLLVGEVVKIPRYLTKLYDGQKAVLDSLADLNYIHDDSIITNVLICDTALWFRHKNTYEIAILLPFEVSSNMRNLYNQATSNREQRLHILTEKMISFYSGCLVAFDKLKKYDAKINVKVFDVGKDNTVLSKIVQEGKLDNVDLIIGPAFKSQVDFINTNVKNENVTILIPFVNENEILEKNDRNIMLNPSNLIVREHIAMYAKANPDNNYFIIQGTTADQIRIANQYLETMESIIEKNSNCKIIKFNGKDLVSVKSMVSKDKENYFILPFSNETTVTNIFLDLFPLKDYPITLIGDKSIMEYESVDPSYYAKVKFSYFSGINIDESKPEAKSFAATYRDVFLCEPDDYSYLGYDAVNFFVFRMIRNGNNFAECMTDNDVFEGLTGVQKYFAYPNYGKNSLTNKTVYINRLQDDFSFKQIYPEEIVID